MQPESTAEEGGDQLHHCRASEQPLEVSTMGVPKDTIEDMMRALSKILIHTLRKETLGGCNSEDMELGNLRVEEDASVGQTQNQLPDDDLVENKIGTKDDCWLGEPVEVWSQSWIKEEDD